MKADLKHFFASHFTTTENKISEVIKYFNPLEAKKNEVLVEQGSICRNLYYVTKGCMKAYFLDSDGRESIRHVAFENQFISSVHSFIKQAPSNEFIGAAESSKILAISYIDFQTALSRSTLFKDFYIKMLEGTYLNNHWRIETFLSLDATQRYEYLLRNNKQLVQRLSNKDLAGYLGITQESLSRIKAKK